jgi:tape measure domain-containing protein
MNVFDLYAKIALDTGDYEKGLEDASGKTSSFADKLKTGLATAAKIGAAAIGSASTAIVALGKIGLDYNSQMEQYTTNFTTMLGSQEAAVQKVEELKKFAASTPLSMDDLAKGTQTLLAFGVESENSTGILRQLGDIALGDADKMQRLSTAFGKATAAGKVTGDTVQQMIDAGWNPLIQISQSAGETMEETQKRMSAGKISVEELQAAMEAVTSGTGQFAGGMEAASHTTQGLISTLQDNAKALVGEVFMPISDGLLGEVLPTAIDAISQLTTAYKEEGLSGMISAAGEIIGTVITEVVDRVPEFLSIAGEIVTSIGSGIMSQSDLLIQNAFDLVLVIADGLIEGADGMLDAAVELVEKLASWIEEYSDVLGEKAVTLILTLVKSIVTNLPKLAVAALRIMASLGTALIDNLPELIKQIPTIIAEIVNGFADAMPDIIDVGKDIVHGLWEGISSLGSWLGDKVSGFFGDMVDGVKDFLGIRSPSRVFASIGEFMMEGLAIGMENSKGEVMETAADIVSEVKDRFSGLVDVLTARQDVGDLEYQLWERTVGKNATDAEKYEKQLEMLTSQQKDQESVVEAAAAAYEAIVVQYGDSSAESYSYQKTLYQEMLAYQDLIDQIQEVIAAKEALGRLNTASVSFEDSGVAVASAGVVNGINSSKQSTVSVPNAIDLTMKSEDGQIFGRWMVPFIRSEDKSNPEVVSDAV